MPLPGSAFLREFSSPVFIETGSHRGDGIVCALKAGFECIYSVDNSAFSYGWCSHRFRRQRTKVHLYLDDSLAFLEWLLSTSIGSPSTFWLDAHYCGGDGEMDGRDVEPEDTGGPLLAELGVIATHRIRTHTLLIDDVRMFGTPHFPALDDVIAAVRAINPDYEIRYHASRLAEGDILVATIP